MSRSALPLLPLLLLPVMTPSGLAQSLEPVNRQLPSWIEFGGEYRTRYEGFLSRNYQEGNDDTYVLNRVRVNMKLKPASWIQFFAQGQDSHVWRNSRIADAPPYQDSWDLRLGYAEIGNSEKSRMALRVGRQEISIGEERMVGSSNWGNTARSFDAVRFFFRLPRTRVDLFAASVVVQTDGHFDRHAQGDNLHGITAQSDWWKFHFEPFVLWRLAPRVRTELGSFGKEDLKTWGIRATGKLNSKTEVVTEMIGQHGSWAADSVRTWGGHWRVVRTLAKDPRVPKLRLEYDHATGDSNPSDGKHQTFELLYPTPHDKLGLADQVGWKNIHHISGVGEWSVKKIVTVQTKYHEWWLASARDGVYAAGGALIARDLSGRSGKHVGRELDLQILASIGPRVRFGGGLGHIFPGEFLKKTTPGSSYTFPYAMLTWSF